MSARNPWGMWGSGGRASHSSPRRATSRNCTTHEGRDVPQVPTSTESGRQSSVWWPLPAEGEALTGQRVHGSFRRGPMRVTATAEPR